MYVCIIPKTLEINSDFDNMPKATANRYIYEKILNMTKKKTKKYFTVANLH